jgi:hypothetical protein
MIISPWSVRSVAFFFEKYPAWLILFGSLCPTLVGITTLLFKSLMAVRIACLMLNWTDLFLDMTAFAR